MSLPRPLWHPISGVLLAEPPTMVGVHALRLLLRAGAVEVRYAGDRMSPTVRHGQVLRVQGPAAPAGVGAVVVAVVEGAPDLLRVAAVDGERLLLRGDGDPAEGHWVARGDVVASTDLASSSPLPGLRGLRRALLDLREAAYQSAESVDGADVRAKYDAQAPFYAQSGATLEPDLLARARAAFAAGGRILVAGSGVGTECFALAAAGYQVCGIDFAPAMVEAARAQAASRSLAVRFLQADLRQHAEPTGSLAGILFTYDVYSFLADRAERVSLLRRMAGWLAPGGAILLSARKARGAWPRLVLTVQWLAGGGRRRWGASHTRWLTVRGEVHRSFVQVFSARALRVEWEEAGLRESRWQGGHGLLTVARAA